METKQKTKCKKAPLVKNILIIYPIQILFLTALSLLIFKIQTSATIESIKTHEKHTIALDNEFIQNSLAWVITDLHHLKDVSNISSNRDKERYFSIFSKNKKVYDQIRVINASGMEVVRINYQNKRPSIAPHSKLQNKSNRYYFTDSFALKRNEIFISPLDLNIEKGAVEIPYKPMLRIATPTFKNNKKNGVFILNFWAKQFISNIGKFSTKDNQTELLNRDGHWLKNSDPKLEWGFIFPDGGNKSFASLHPKEWELISTSDDGQFETDLGLITFSRVYPVKNLSANYYWILMRVMTPKTLYHEYNIWKRWLTIFLSISSVAILILSFLYAKNSCEKRRARQLMERSKTANAMIATYNHEINNPLTIAMGYLEIALDKIQTQDLKTALETTKEALNRISKIVDNIKDIGEKSEIEFNQYIESSKTIKFK